MCCSSEDGLAREMSKSAITLQQREGFLHCMFSKLLSESMALN